MKKRLLSIAFCLVMLCSLLSVTAGATTCLHTGYTGVSTADALKTAVDNGESVYLNADIELSSTLTVSGNLTLCLNGHTLNLAADKIGSVISVTGTLTLTDCGTTVRPGYIDADTYLWTSGSSVEDGDITCNLTGGIITGGTESIDGGIYKAGCGVLVDGGTFTMNGGIIAGNCNGVYVSGGTFSMVGGTIAGNKSLETIDSIVRRSGSGVSLANSSTFTMTSGTITGNKSTSTHQAAGGGGVYVNGGSTFTMSGGTISYNKAASGGGGVCMNHGTFKMSGTAEISNNSDGGVEMETNATGSCTFTMTGGTISGNTKGSGGGVAVGSGTFAMTGGTISGNTSNGGQYTGGGGVYVGNGAFEMSGTAAISNNTAINDSRGGGVYLSSGTFTMKGGTISGNNTISSFYSPYGGGVYVYGGTFNVSGSPVITGNTVKSSTANNVYLPSGKVITVSGGLDTNANIGVTMNTYGVLTSGWNNHMSSVAEADIDEYFTADDNTKEFSLVGGEVKLAVPHTHGNWEYSYDGNSIGGTITATCGVADCSLPENNCTATVVVENSNTYDGIARRPVSVNYSSDWTDAGAGTVTITGAEILVGTGSATLSIGNISIPVEFTIGKGTLMPEYFTVTLPTNLTYDGTAKVATVTETRGNLDQSRIIVKYAAQDYDPIDPIAAQAYAVMITLEENDYYNVPDGYLLFGANGNFTIAQKDISQSDVSIDAIPNQNYTGSAIEPALTVKHIVSENNVITLEKGRDYTVVYGENTNIGENAGSVTISGIGNYTGTKTVYFNITYATKNAEDVLTWELADTGWFNIANPAIFRPLDGYSVSTDPASGFTADSIQFNDEGSDLTRTVYVKDGASKIYQVELTFKQDKGKPYIGDFGPWDAEWHKDSLTLHVDGESDATSGLPADCISYDGGNTWTSATEHTVAENGTYQVIIRDKAGNIGGPWTETVTKIDNDGPVAKISVRGAQGTPGWYISDVTVTVSEVEDTGSGVSSDAYSFDGGTTWQSNSSKTYTENAENVMICIRDNVGNITTLAALDDIKIDKNAPAFDVDGAHAGWANADVTLTVTVTDANPDKWEYSPDNSTWTEGTGNTYVISAEGTTSVYFRFTDKAGNKATAGPITVKIDKTAPEISGVQVDPIVPGDWHTSVPTVTVTATDGESGLAALAYSFDGGTNWQAENTKTYNTEGVHTVAVWVKDAVGNIAKRDAVTIKVDTAAPTITNVTGNPAEWTKNDVTLTVTATDSTSGIAQYSFDGGSTWQSGNTKTYTANTNNIVIKVKDAAGNVYVYTHETINITKIDKTAPEVAFGSLPGVDGESAWYKSNVTVPVIITEVNLSTWEYSMDGGSSWTTGSDGSFTINTDGNYTDKVMIRATDQAGNVATSSAITIKVDTTAPTITGVTGNPAEWTKNDVTLTVAADDSTSGVAQYSFDDSLSWQIDNTKTYTANTNGIVIKVKDAAGNVYTHETISITKIDKTAPVVAFGSLPDVDGENGWYKSDVTVPVIITEANLSTWEYSLDGGSFWTTGSDSSFTISTNGNYTDKVMIRATDQAGNVATSSAITVKLDKATPAAPTVVAKVGEDNYVSGTWTIGDVVFTLSGSEATSEVAKYQYSANGGTSWTDVTGNTFTHTASTDENGVTYIFRAVNNAGTEGTASDSVKVMKRQPYTIVFNANAEDVTGTMGNLTAYLDTNVVLSENTFTREGYSFMGWATAADGAVVYTNKQNVPEALVSEMNAEVTLYAVWSENPVITGTITGTGDTVTSVKLRDLDGTEYPAVVTPSGNDYIYAVAVPVGTYQLVVEATVDESGVTLTYAEDMSESKTHDIAIPTAKKNSSVVEIVGDAPKAIVDGLEAIAAADGGSGVIIKLTVTAEAADSQDAEQTAIKGVASGKQLQFIDLTLTKDGSDIGGSNNQLLTIVIPFEKGNKQNIAVYRYHGTEAETLMEDPASNEEGFVVGVNSITIHAKKFSTYAIGYTVPVYYDPSYRITVESADNGTVKANRTWAYYGNTITLTVTPEEGCELDSLTVTDSRGNEIALIDKGDGKYTFKMPYRNVTVTAVFHRCPSTGLTDVDCSQWYHEAIDYVLVNALMDTADETTFDRTSPATRATLVEAIWRNEDCPVADYLMTYPDVDRNAGYAEAIRWASSVGIVNGFPDGTFHPDEAINREQLATLFYRYEQYKGEGFEGDWTYALEYVDADEVSAWAYEAVCWNTMNSIVQGDGTNFDPKGTAERAHVAQLLMNYLERN